MKNTSYCLQQASLGLEHKQLGLTSLQSNPQSAFESYHRNKWKARKPTSF